MNVGRRLHLSARAFRDVGDASAGPDLLDEIVGLAGERLVDLIGAPLLLDLGLRLFEGEFVRRVDLGDLEPDIAAVLGLQRRFVQPDVGSEGGAQQFGLVRQVDRRAFGIDARGVDRGDRLPGQAHRLRGFENGLARHPQVLDLVVQGLDLVARAGSGDLPLHLLGDLLDMA